ncbi:MAG: response regulator [Chitinivibrionales bacterium]|nr:response regulator [Chitinivibrionales bacterium]
MCTPADASPQNIGNSVTFLCINFHRMRNLINVLTVVIGVSELRRVRLMALGKRACRRAMLNARRVRTANEKYVHSSRSSPCWLKGLCPVSGGKRNLLVALVCADIMRLYSRRDLACCRGAMNARSPTGQRALAMMHDALALPSDAIRVLILDDSGFQRKLIRRRLSAYPFYFCLEASTARQAEELIRQRRPLHVCTYDLGITDLEADQFALVRRYSNEVAFMVVTGRGARRDCFRAHREGVIDLVDKKDVAGRAFMRRLNYAFLCARWQLA